jgi:predicted ABC-type ATPase
MTKIKRQPRCILIAGPNGAGKTTFARRYLPENARVVHFINADLIASGLSPLKPEVAAIAAARMVLGEMAIASTSCISNSVPRDWRCGESPLECVKAATMFHRLTFFAGL